MNATVEPFTIRSRPSRTRWPKGNSAGAGTPAGFRSTPTRASSISRMASSLAPSAARAVATFARCSARSHSARRCSFALGSAR
ncbi:hypothetical protein BE08_29455 [Sorangium cellulosum]|uniref:Uncharacterized protein n=1 Tax=Sorangium cellulosum TaxID=56 RepID=A0A150PDV8_SORCE|nr:hypothetical protein BE08_29455 [Sorangium cellulosum]